ncbi:MAG: GTPase Era [Lachnospiraceae bacterium]|nr:GTPase Era [Lachnospiraceae bacterium]
MDEENNNFRSGYVTIIGRPNVGKSTLMNCLIGQKIAITSDKPQTTRHKIQTVYTCDEAQIIFLDTPGIHKAKNRLGDYMDKVAESTLADVDVILMLVEPTTFIGAGERSIMEQLSKAEAPVILVINKTDTLSDSKEGTRGEKLAECIKAYSECFDFAEIVPVSAKKNKGTDELLKTMIKYLPYGPMYYDEDTVTEETERNIAGEIIREKALRLLGDEVPHGIAVTIEKMHERVRPETGETVTDIEATIICERDSHKGIIIGKGGEMLKKIGTKARLEIEKAFEYKVNLKLWVKVRKDWRDSEKMLKSFGYDPEAINGRD